MKKLILLMLGILLVSSFISAQEVNFGTGKIDECIDLIQLCADCTYNNVTSIIYPNKTVINLDEPMSQTGTQFNYTFCNTSGLGEYLVNGVGDLEGIDTVWVYPFTITPTGNEQTTSQGIGSAMFLFLMLALTTIFGYLGFKFLDSEYLWVVGLFFLFFMILFIVYDVWLGYEYHKNWSGINDGSKMPEIIFYIFMFILVSGFAVSGILLFTKWEKLKSWWARAKEEKERSLEDDGKMWE